MSEKIRRYDPESKCGCNIEHVDWEGGDWCKFTDVSALESRLAEAEKTVADWEAKAVSLGCEGHPVDGHAGYPIGYSPVDEMLGRFNALSARVRELEGALGPVIDRRSMLVDEPLVVTLCLTRDEYARAARALKGEW